MSDHTTNRQATVRDLLRAENAKLPASDSQGRPSQGFVLEDPQRMGNPGDWELRDRYYGSQEAGLTPAVTAPEYDGTMTAAERDSAAAQEKADLSAAAATAPTGASAAAVPARNVPRPDPSQGGQGGGGLSLDAQIAEAQSKGDFRTAIRLQHQKFDTRR